MTEPHLSPNVSLELGYMLAQNKRCLLLIASCINNAIMRAEDFNPYAQTEGERRSP